MTTRTRLQVVQAFDRLVYSKYLWADEARKASLRAALWASGSCRRSRWFATAQRSALTAYRHEEESTRWAQRCSEVEISMRYARHHALLARAACLRARQAYEQSWKEEQ